MTLQWIPLEALVPHPENSNRMPPRLLAKLKANIQRTGLYEPLVVRPANFGSRISDFGLTAGGKGGTGDSGRGTGTAPAQVPSNPKSEIPNPKSETVNPPCQYQILNGHHRAEVLRDLGHTHARCDVWEVDDREARILLATLNRLEGRDDPSARAALVAHLAEGRTPEDLANLLPEPPDAVERLLKLAAPPPAPLDPGDLPALPRPMTFFLTEEQHAVVSEALKECGARSAECGVNSDTQARRHKGTEARKEGTDSDAGRASGPLTCTPRSALRTPHCLSRADRLERLALWYLEARNLR